MPRKGYKSITVPAKVYEYLYNEWLTCKDELSAKHGIRSFSGYVSYRLGQLAELSGEQEPFIMLNHGADGVKVQDTKLHRVADIKFTPKGIHCPICDASYCEHVRFALSQPDIQKIIKRKQKEGWKLELPDES